MTVPTSPTPLFDGLPSWLVQRTRSAGIFSRARIRFLFFALAFFVAFYLTFTSLRRNHEFRAAHGVDSAGTSGGGSGVEVLSVDGSVIGVPATSKSGDDGDREPASISGALSDLHHAVSDRLSSLRPWTSRPVWSSSNSSFGAASVRPGKKPSVSEAVVTPDREDLGERTRIGKATVIVGGRSVYERAVRTHEAHDRAQGYRLHVLRHNLMDDVWTKPAYILSVLLRELTKPESERLQWLLWVDGDTILLNPYMPIETFLPPAPEFDDVHLLVCNDWNGLNNGVFTVRVNQWAMEFFAAWVSYRHYRPDTPLPFRDQSGMEGVLKDKVFGRHAVEVPQRWFNAYPGGDLSESLAPFQARRGDLLVHFAGIPDKEERMVEWLEKVEQHPPDWEIEVEHTSYPSEAREFWSQQRRLRTDNKQGLAEIKTKASTVLDDLDEEERMYQDRLAESEIQEINSKKVELRVKINDEMADVGEIDSAMEDLKTATSPLTAAVAAANKILLKEAHTAIFAAEKDLLEHAGETTKLVTELETRVTRLKELVLQEKWHKSEVEDAVNAVKRARTDLETGNEAAMEQQRALEEKKVEQEAQNEAAAKEKADLLGNAVTTVIVAAPPPTVTTIVVIETFA